MEIIERFTNSFVFWAAWIIIPLIMEIIPSVGSVFILFRRLLFQKEIPKPIIYPEISIIIPVYNSQDTLEACIRSINDCDYPNSQIRIFLVNNRGTDNSFAVYTKCQKEYPDLIMQWLNAEQGKSRALNLALYNSEGKYIIHIDSDGVLEKRALTNMVDKFEHDTTINCMTGAIMTDPKLVQAYPWGFARLFRKMEFMEYAQAFLAGRNYASDLNSIYTVSGAFSAFRKSAILQSRLYNTETLAEDTQITFQMRYLQGERIYMSEKSIFFVDPIENVDKLYTQRQRWQRGSLEVAKMFGGRKMRSYQMFTDVSVKTLMYDHTFAFPRIIWYLALICLTFVGYSGKTVLLATAILFGLYTICGYLYYFSTIGFLRDFPEERRYYRRQWWIVPLLPFFNLLVFFIRFAGIINSINTSSAWKTRTLTEEWHAFRDVIAQDLSTLRSRIEKVRGFVNTEEPETLGNFEVEQEKNSNHKKQKELKRVNAWLVLVIVLVFTEVMAVLGWGQLKKYEDGILSVYATQQDGYVQLVLDQINLKENRDDAEIIQNILHTLDSSGGHYWTMSEQNDIVFVKDVLETNRYKGFTTQTYYSTDSADAFIGSLQVNKVTHATIEMNDREYIASGVLFHYNNMTYHLCLLTGRDVILDQNDYMSAKICLVLLMILILLFIIIGGMVLVVLAEKWYKKYRVCDAENHEIVARIEQISQEKTKKDRQFETKYNAFEADALRNLLMRVEEKPDVWPLELLLIRCPEGEARDQFFAQLQIRFNEKTIRVIIDDTYILLVNLRAEQIETEERNAQIAALGAECAAGKYLTEKPQQYLEAVFADMYREVLDHEQQ